MSSLWFEEKIVADRENKFAFGFTFRFHRRPRIDSGFRRDQISNSVYSEAFSSAYSNKKIILLRAAWIGRLQYEQNIISALMTIKLGLIMFVLST